MKGPRLTDDPVFARSYFAWWFRARASRELRRTIERFAGSCARAEGGYVSTKGAELTAADMVRAFDRIGARCTS